MATEHYKDWLLHIARRGRIVIYPRCQASLRTPPSEFTDNAISAVRDAIERLATEAGHVVPDWNHFAVVGHSMGGVLTANLAAMAAQSGLPQPAAVMAVEPGKTWGPPRIQAPLATSRTFPRRRFCSCWPGKTTPSSTT